MDVRKKNVRAVTGLTRKSRRLRSCHRAGRRPPRRPSTRHSTAASPLFGGPTRGCSPPWRAAPSRRPVPPSCGGPGSSRTTRPRSQPSSALVSAPCSAAASAPSVSSRRRADDAGGQANVPGRNEQLVASIDRRGPRMEPLREVPTGGGRLEASRTMMSSEGITIRSSQASLTLQSVANPAARSLARWVTVEVVAPRIRSARLPRPCFPSTTRSACSRLAVARIPAAVVSSSTTSVRTVAPIARAGSVQRLASLARGRGASSSPWRGRGRWRTRGSR